jgi:hypothetical protein
MAQRDRRDIANALPRKGFVPRTGESDHDYFDLHVDGKKVGVQTKLSRGSGYKVYGDPLLGAMCTNLGLTKKDLLLLIDCDLDGPSYVAKLLASGRIKLPDPPRPRRTAQPTRARLLAASALNGCNPSYMCLTTG